MAVPFVGRERERKELDELLDTVGRGEGVLVVLTGPAGIGKSRLAREIARSAAAFQVHWATCGPADSVPPYWPWMQVVRDLLAGDPGLTEEAGRRWPAIAALGRAAPVVAASDRQVGVPVLNAFSRRYGRRGCRDGGDRRRRCPWPDTGRWSTRFARRSSGFVRARRDAVRSNVPAGTRADLHLRAGNALARLRDRGQPVEPAELAYHFLEAGPVAGVAAISYAAAAGARAMTMLAYEDAVRFFNRALAPGPPDATGRAELLVALGEAEAAVGERAAARTTHLHAAAAARDAGRPDLLARAALGVSGTAGFEVSLLDREQIHLLEESLATLPVDALATRAWVTARLSVAVSLVDTADRRGQARAPLCRSR